MLKVIKVFLFSLVFLSCSRLDDKFSNATQQDSIYFYINKSNENIDSFPLFLKNIQKAEKFNSVRQYDSLYFVNSLKISFSYLNAGLNKNFKNILDDNLQLAIKLEDTLNVARSYAHIGNYYSLESKRDSAVLYFQLAEKKYFELRNNLEIGRWQLAAAKEKAQSRDYIGAEKSATSALRFLKLSNAVAFEYEAFNLLGLVCNYLGDYERSDEYLKKALLMANTNDLENYGFYFSNETTLNNLANLNINEQKYSEAITYINRALTEKKIEFEYPYLCSNLYYNRANSYLALNKLDEAYEDIKKSYEIRKANDLNSELSDSYLLFSAYYVKIGDTVKALEYGQKALALSKELNVLNLQVESLSALSKINEESYLNYSKDFITLNDSLINMERKNSEKFARIEFEADEMRRQNEILSLRNRNIYTLAALIIATLLIVYLFRERRNRLIRLRLLEAQQNANEEVYNLMLTQQQRLEEVIINEKQRIGQDLHDGVLGRLFGARMNLDSMTIDLVRPEAVERRNHFIKELQEIEQDIREVSHELSKQKKSIIDNFMLIFTQLLEDQKTAHKTQLEYDVDVNIRWDLVNNNIKINLYRIVQEALQNINKYAEASLIIIIIQKKANNIQAVITDDGVGFEVDKKSKGIGMKNITSRVEACYGSFSITSKKGEGTKIKVVFPLKYFKS
jgi:signal transduction histidine kinase